MEHRWTQRNRDNRENMICRILLLIILNSCLCAATFVVKVTQSSYQAEENHSITLEWTFTTTPDQPWRDLFILCSLSSPQRVSVLYQVYDGVEVLEPQNEQFSGRVQSDKDVLREGRIRLHVSRLRTEDSGLYLCDVETDYGSGSASCQLSVSAADVSQPQRPALDPEPGGRGRKGLYAALGLTAAAAAAPPDVSTTQRPVLDPEPGCGGKTSIHLSLTLTAVAAAAAAAVAAAAAATFIVKHCFSLGRQWYKS
ncbi:uncharacterized protein LOC118565832 isoform X3 [Fundulus heteroclitus]|uniref:uncharacterized protein LOC118565832 isoform X3 n=1 Tax=Fundulus heteroclitus TaxID=8078 RepID=UPI00165C898B|nr:uncharacterized protein LOC118565832 isoform X3 [Fundulus heteroclitus]